MGHSSNDNRVRNLVEGTLHNAGLVLKRRRTPTSRREKPERNITCVTLKFASLCTSATQHPLTHATQCETGFKVCASREKSHFELRVESDEVASFRHHRTGSFTVLAVSA